MLSKIALRSWIFSALVFSSNLGSAAFGAPKCSSLFNSIRTEAFSDESVDNHSVLDFTLLPAFINHTSFPARHLNSYLVNSKSLLDLYTYELVENRVPYKDILLFMRTSAYTTQKGLNAQELISLLETIISSPVPDMRRRDERQKRNSEYTQLPVTMHSTPVLSWAAQAKLLRSAPAVDRFIIEGVASRQFEQGAGLIDLLRTSPAFQENRLSLQQAETLIRKAQDELQLISDWSQHELNREANGISRRVNPPEVREGWEDLPPISSEVRTKTLAKLIEGSEKSENDLVLLWRESQAYDLPHYYQNRQGVRPSEVNSVEQRLTPEGSQKTVEQQRSDRYFEQYEAFYKQVYGNYESRIGDRIVEMLHEVDRKTRGEEDFGFVSDWHTGQHIATLRVFDGSPVHNVVPMLPLERAFSYRKIDISNNNPVKNTRYEAPWKRTFEIGKFTIDPTMDPAVRQRALNLLEFWLLDAYVERYPDAEFFVHVASEAHLRLYKSRYGFKVIEEISVPNPKGEPTVEHILSSSAKDFALMLRKRLSLKP